MGRGDKKTKKGKRTIGSFGNSRLRKDNKAKATVVAKPVVVASADAKPKAAKKAAKKVAE